MIKLTDILKNIKEGITPKTFAVYQLSHGQPTYFYNEQRKKFLPDAKNATLYTEQEAKEIMRNLLKPLINQYQETGEHYTELHIGDLYKKNILKNSIKEDIQETPKVGDDVTWRTIVNVPVPGARPDQKTAFLSGKVLKINGNNSLIMHNGKTVKVDTRILTIVKSKTSSSKFKSVEFEIDTDKKLSELFPMLPSNVVSKLQQKLDKLAPYSNSHSYSGDERPQRYYDGVNSLANMLVKELNKLGYNVEAGEGDDDVIEINLK